VTGLLADPTAPFRLTTATLNHLGLLSNPLEAVT
jgi:hypothetical protein